MRNLTSDRTLEDQTGMVEKGSHSAGDVDRRLEDLNLLCDRIVHDMRNHLNVIQSNNYLLRQRLGEVDARSQRNLDRVDEQVNAALRYLDDLSAFYRINRLTKQPIDLALLVRDTAAQADLPEGQELQLNLPDDLGPVAADPALVTAAIRAILRNAAEAQTSGGIIQISVRAGQASQEVVVEDSGEGPSPDLASSACDPFVTTREGHPGLGLTLAHRVAERHGGTIRLEPRSPAGCRAILALPTS